MTTKQTEKSKLIVKLVIVAIICVFVALITILIVQNVKLHKLENEKNAIHNDLSHISLEESKIDKQLEEIQKSDYQEKLNEQEKNYGTEDEYLFN